MVDDAALEALKQEIVKAQSTADRALEAIRSRSAAEQFVAAHPEFHATPSNASIIVGELQERNLDLTSVESYEAVFNDPAVRAKLTTAPEPAPETQPQAEEQPAKRGKLTSDDRAFLEQVERMPSSEFRKKLQDKAFTARYNRLVEPPVVGN